MEKVRPLKQFGQNYLLDQNILNKIADEINPQPGDHIIEIGPGTGALTEKLIDKTGKLTAVEIDNRVIENLLLRFPSLNLINSDFLDVDLRSVAGETKLRVAGNIPYYLTSSILFKLIEYNDIIEDAVLMTQLEVAQRISAKKGTKEYGILAVLLQFFCDVKFCFKVSPNVFYPRPKIFSAIIHLTLKNVDLSGTSKKTFISIVKAAFGNRRKTIKNSFGNSIFAQLNFEKSGIDLSLRAEQLGLNDFLALSRFADSETGRRQNNSIK